MVRRSKLLLAVVVVVASAGIGLAYFGMIESIVSPEQLPGSPVAGVAGIIAVVGVGVLASRYLDTKAWTEMGTQTGLTAGGRSQFASGPPEKSDKPVLTGTVEGRPVRARAYTTGGRNESTVTYTVVETELGTPVDWHAAFGTPQTDQGPEDHPVGAVNTQTVDGVGVRGDISEDLARAVLTPAVRDAVANVEGEVSVGDPIDNAVGDMLNQIDGGEGGIAGTVAEGMLKMADETDDGPSRVVQHRVEGLLTDGGTLTRRIEAVTAVADAVEEASAGVEQPPSSGE
jgi:hypothetical protein